MQQIILVAKKLIPVHSAKKTFLTYMTYMWCMISMYTVSHDIP